MEVTVDSKKYKGNTTNDQWSNLTPDLLSFIITKQEFADRIRFRSVCKDWNNIPIGGRPINELPWVMSHKDFRFYNAVSVKKPIVRLSDPVHKKTHTIPNFPTGMVVGYSDYSRLWSICASKCGWILLANRKNLFLYSPFKNKVITLPTLSFLIPYFDDKATFSSTNPTSPSCVFVVIRRLDHGKLRISSYRYGDIDWRTKIFEGGFNGRVASLVCTEKGVCYFVLQCGKLGAFNVDSQECTWLANSVWIPRDKMQLVDFNGDLLLAKCSFMYDWKVFRYDVNERSWIEQKTLGDRAILFVCSCSSYLRRATGDTTDLADKIVYSNLYDNESETRVYSLKDGKQYKKGGPYDWMVKDSLEKVLIEPPY